MEFTYIEDPRTDLEYEEIEPECIICGSRTCEYFYFDRHGEPIGCDDCIRREAAYE